MLINIIIVVIVSVILSKLILSKVIMISYVKKLYDVPNERSSHVMPTPRLGGITFLPSLFIVTGIYLYVTKYIFFIPENSFSDVLNTQEITFYISLIVLFFIGIMDDLIGLSYKYKLLYQTIIASLFPLNGLSINTFYGFCGIDYIPFWLSFIITVFFVVYLINALNFIDGIDGLASGIGIISLVTIGIISYMLGLILQTVLSFTLLGSLLIFFRYNVFGTTQKGNKIFMGDTGSMILGYVLSYLLLNILSYKYTDETQVLEFSLISLSSLNIPLFDLVCVVIIRLCKGSSPFLPDRSHIHHRFMQKGFSSERTLVTLLLISIISVLYTLVLSKFTINILISVNVIFWLILQFYLDVKYVPANIRNLTWKNLINYRN